MLGLRSIWREADLRPARDGADTRELAATNTEALC